MKQDLNQVKIDSRVKNETAEEFLMRQPESWRPELTEMIYKFLDEGKELDDQEIFRACREANREKQRKACLTMSNERVTVWLRQGEGEDEIYMSLTMPKQVADKMGEIRSQDSEKWKARDFDLHSEAIKRVKEEKTKKSKA